MAELVLRKRLRLNRDPSRVIAKLFVPGALPEMDSRVGGVVRRVVALSDAEVDASYAQTLEAFGSRHRDLEQTFRENFRTIEHHLDHGPALDARRRLLIAAHFTHEYAIEGAALTNPSMVAHPDQSGLKPGELRFLMSARAIGEGHLSCVEFRTGVVGSGGELRVDEPSPYAAIGTVGATDQDRALQDAALYRLEFPADTDVSEHVLWPRSPTERHGIEDARFVRWQDPDDADSDYPDADNAPGAATYRGTYTATYRGTYTAYSGADSATQLVETADFRTFHFSRLTGPAVGSKGLALFPRRVDGRHVALSRWDRENNAIAASDDGRTWTRAGRLDAPRHEWELTQVGNCGSPIETEAGWLVLTHGVGPMRVYALGAILLDLKDPTRVIGALPEPLLIAAPDQRDGYVPNVVYSCGALRHEDLLVVPYGFGDMGIEFATVPIPGLLDRLDAD